ncbi:32489_t:CDS:1, partial [Racocetra persica]
YEYDWVTFFENSENRRLYKVRFFGNKEERTPFKDFKVSRLLKLAKVLVEDYRRRLFGRQLRCSHIIIIAFIVIFILLVYFLLAIGFIFVYIIAKFLPYEQADKSLPNEKADNNTEVSSYKCKISKSSLEENIGITLDDASDPLIIRKYIIYTTISLLRMKTKYQFKIESIVITEKQRNELRHLLCGIVNEKH